MAKGEHMLNGIRLRNFRSFQDTGKIDFRPITLLLGQNSSGKSTLLRSLPLLRQSVRTRTNAPLLWYGDLVDFGSFKEVHSSNAPESLIGLSFYFDKLRTDNPYFRSSAPRLSPILENVEFGISLVEFGEFTRLSKFYIVIEEDMLVVELDQKGSLRSLKVNNVDYTKTIPKEMYIFSQDGPIPQIIKIAEKSKVAFAGYTWPTELTDESIFEFFASRFDRRVSPVTIRSLTRKLMYASKDSFISRIKSTNLNLKIWDSVKDSLLGGSDKQLSELRSLYLIGLLPEILYNSAASLASSVRELAYVGPSRATGERYYRHQELAIDQIDPQGRNLAMFLYSLDLKDRENFSLWLEEQIGYSLNVGRQGGHIQIELKERGGVKAHNLADMGYGFSQILPVMAQIWGRRRSSSRSVGSPFIAIEQPELHLHPAYQARIADVMAASLKANVLPSNRKPCFIVETHSESLINRLGELIYDKIISRDDVIIYLFHKMPETDNTEISRSSFDDTGSLIDWPLGFFSSRAVK